MTSIFERYHEAASQLDTLIERTPTPADSSREAIRARAEERMGRLLRFLTRLGDPQRGYPIVHVGGTSGKGSTSTTIAAILTEAGYRTGLHTSPYLQTPAEKLQISGQLIDPGVFADLADEILAEHERWIADGEEPLTYGEAWSALTWWFFTHEQVDVAVVEVGAGGRFDLTNILMPTLSVITSVGIDHTHTLGETIEEIAWHKAGIIKSGLPALSAVPHPAARRIIAEEAAAQGASLTQLDLATLITDVITGPDGTTWRETATGETFRMGMCGTFQARNGATAVAAARLLRDHGVPIPDNAIATGLLRARIPGRAELVADRVPVLLDGAHNAEKIAALAVDVPALLPTQPGARRIGIVGLLDAKQGDEMLRGIVPAIDMLIATAPRVLAKEPKDADQIAALARASGFAGEVIVEPVPARAIARALELARNDAGDSILVTGSLYLVGNIREQWFHERDIVEGRSPWARSAAGSPIEA
jgi:dihydrofolate synthase/folylpolyglutamate synthase